MQISARLSSTTIELEIIDQKSSRASKRSDQPGRRNLIIEAICYQGFKSKFNGLPFFQKKKILGFKLSAILWHVSPQFNGSMKEEKDLPSADVG